MPTKAELTAALERIRTDARTDIWYMADNAEDAAAQANGILAEIEWTADEVLGA